jgi:hypothetical protein
MRCGKREHLCKIEKVLTEPKISLDIPILMWEYLIVVKFAL